ncbi:acyl-CoA dehydrogenase family protein [Nocardioides alcanivorans]|uniref:acyl-CoA dehydrogenase family protein n=1 Tax=Nocardioides alcanivorans TaxID=2897352 RepID=UPI001F3A0335|nr:acyl-CoA dehydrogenase family protein [Nocardioides alcanivorans]
MILTDAEQAETRGELAQVVDAMLDRVSPRADAVLRADRAAEGIIDEALWTRLNAEVGVAGLAVPEAWGGSGASIAELAVVSEALGRQVATVPLLGTWLALEVLVRSGDRNHADTVSEALGKGLALAVVLEESSVRATQVDGQWLLDGEVDRVVDVAAATTLVIPARAGDELRWFVVPTDNVAVVRREALDLTRSLSLVTCSAAPARAVVTTSAADLLENVRDLAAVLTAAEQLGVAEQAVADAVAFAKEREQFGRAIGSFQAIKHHGRPRRHAPPATGPDRRRSPCRRPGA